MIPLKDYNPTRRFSVISAILIAINLVVFLQDRMTGHLERMLVPTEQGSMISTVFVGGLSERWALVPLDFVTHFSTHWVNLFSSMFLHGNWLHVGSNMLYLWIFGNNIEDILGRVRFILFYFACGTAAAMAQIVSEPSATIPMVGASGAIAGVMGAYLMRFPRARVLTLVPIFIFFTTIRIPAYLIIGYWAVLQFLNASLLGAGDMVGVSGGVAYYAHIGGFVAGIAIIIAMTPTPYRRDFPGTWSLH